MGVELCSYIAVQLYKYFYRSFGHLVLVLLDTLQRLILVPPFYTFLQFRGFDLLWHFRRSVLTTAPKARSFQPKFDPSAHLASNVVAVGSLLITSTVVPYSS